MRRFPLKSLLLAVSGLSCLLVAASAPTAQSQLTGPELIDHLNKTIAWYGHVSSADQTATAAEDVVIQENVRQSSKQVVRKAFAFARAEAAVLDSPKNRGSAPANAASGDQARTLEQSAAAANERIVHLQAQIDDVNAQIGKAPKRKLATLLSLRDTLTADLAFAKASQKALNELLQFANVADKSGGLIGQINLLANSDSVPAALSDLPQNTPAAAASSNAKGAAAVSFRVESVGIAPLLGRSLQLLRARNQIDSLLRETARLNDHLSVLRNPLRVEIRQLVAQGDAIANAAASETDPTQLNAQRQQVERLSARFKALSATILPLSEQGLALETTLGGLEQWRNSADGQLQYVLGYLGIRVGTLAVVVIVLLVISEIFRRATFQYVRDTRRRRQFVLIRRFVVGTVITIFVILTSVSGIGSLATVAGFVTAGLAVALQNVILSVVAYFFLIGRYGLRAGDRVTVAGVAGQVIEVGLVRLYLMEMAGSGTDLHATGRVAVFSNSVIFQPAALIKQAPGTEYTWHVVSAVFAGETTLEEGRSRMTGAVDEIYKTYAPVIEQQHRVFERTANLQLPEPSLVSRGRFTETGVEISVRYPVVIDDMTEVDEKVIEAVAKAARNDPALHLASGGYPKVAPAT